ncbi:hypothetical protein HWN40_09240 [Methanolobus zinderi]|uniref:Uncharacterized protein n=1 Tax=Methanolobus zinderi TaxID=536044 RepID=A0A7D5IC50_9EURY|nr:hypothetical protein [Methanolobus zinderi]QLC50409.1 hypothetical protein HWN40_09240 [Methanolobus zinderi]
MPGKGKTTASFFQDTRAYIPFAVIGVFVLLSSVFVSFNMAKTDYELAETIYETDGTDMGKTAADMAAADLSRCLNYAGMEALQWQGEHPVIKSEDAAYEEWGDDGFSADPATRDVEPGSSLVVDVKLPSNVFEAIYCVFADKPRALIVKGPSGIEYQNISYDESHSFWTSSKFEEEITIPENAEDGYAYLIFMYGDETKATNWFHVGSNPLKDIAASHFNEFLEDNYQGNLHTFNNYAINVEQNISASRIKIGTINGTLKREIERSAGDDTDYILYYTMSIDNLNYTLVDLSTGESYNRSMDVSTVITSREPLLAELTSEYERALSSGTTSDIVLGATNIRTFTYGPWQHYLNGPLNIVTGPSLTSSVNAGTLYTQKRVFDSVDPWALTYTTYYSGKVLYNDIKQDTSSYEEKKGSNLSTTYDNLSDGDTFNMSVSDGINESMMDANTSIEEVENNSRIVVSVSNFTDEVYSNWVYNDVDVWTDDAYPDLIHDVTNDVYSGTIQGQVFRDGFNEITPYNLQVGPTSYDSVSYETGESKDGKDVKWKGHYPVIISHTCALTPDYNFAGTLNVNHEVNIDASSHKWYFTSVQVEHVSTDVVCEGVDVTYKYLGNDSLIDSERVDGYLSKENHSFDWQVKYNLKFKVKTRWNINYNYHWSYKTYSPGVDGTGSWNFYSGDSSGSLKNEPLENIVSVSHTQTESENISIVYHQVLPSGGYTGINSHDSGSANDYRKTTVIVDGIPREDKDCSDAADNYRDEFVDIYSIEKHHLLYPDGKNLSTEKVYCDVPYWLHKNMTQEMENMFAAINEDNPTRDVSLLGKNLGKNPTTLIKEASLDLATEMAGGTKRDSFIDESQYMNAGQYNTSSDACRLIAKNEAYDRLLIELEERNKNVEGSFESYIDNSFSNEQGHSLLDLVKNAVSTDIIFNNPAMEKASTALANEVGIIETMEITGEPQSKYNWTENMTLLVDQYPDYLYHDPDFDMQSQYEWTDEFSGATIYPLGVRNVCVFSTGIGDDIAGMLEAASSPLKDAVSQSMSQSLAEANAEIDSLLEDVESNSVGLAMNGVSTDTTFIEENRTKMMDAYSDSIREQVPKAIAVEVAKDPVLRTLISESDVTEITSNYLNSLSDAELVNMTANNTLQEEIFSRVSDEVSSNSAASSDETEVALYRLEADMRIGVADGVCVAIQDCQEVIDECFANINSELEKKLDESSEKLTGEFAEKIEKRLQKSMKLVPCGLPVIPPHWVCTVNVWEYDVKGAYREFEVIDNDNECMFNPYFGHNAQVYVRKDEEIFHPTKNDNIGSPIYLGDNHPIEFKFSGYAATIVGPGPKGVGDKVGDRDEKSIFYDDFESQF